MDGMVALFPGFTLILRAIATKKEVKPGIFQHVVNLSVADVQVGRLYRKLVPMPAIRFATMLESSLGTSCLGIYLTLVGTV